MFADTRNLPPGKGLLYLKVHRDNDLEYDGFDHEYSGGVETLTCRWTGKRSGEKPFLCHKYDAGRAKGYRLYANKPTGAITGDMKRSPLALPFLSFTAPQSGRAAKHMVFLKADTGYGRDLIAAVPVGTNVRTSPKPGDRPGDLDDGWWYVDEIDGSSVEVAEW